MDLYPDPDPPDLATDAPRTPAGKRSARSLARRDGPLTSRLAAESVADSVGELQRWAVECVRQSPGKTARELARLYCPQDPKRIDRRLGEAASLGLLKRGPARACRVSGRRAATWMTPEDA